MIRNQKNLAKAVIVEIIRQSGGVLRNKTNLFKAFWKAHVAAASMGRSLSTYPIVRMPNGPGIDKFDRLMGELMSEGAVVTEMTIVGPYSAFEFRLVAHDAYDDCLTADDVIAIRNGVEFISGKTSAECSEWSHQQSRSWVASKDGDLLDTDLDSIPEDEYERMSAKFKAMPAMTRE